MTLFSKSVFIFAFAGLSAVVALGQDITKPPLPMPVDQIIHKFAQAESDNKKARDYYTFTQDYEVKTIGLGGNVSGEFHRISDIVLDDRGNRFEKITYFPAPTLDGLMITPEDLQDLAGVQPFALALDDLPKYQIDYIGKEKIDELNTYIFDVKPKKIVEGQRYFQGRIWVDDQDLQVVKAAGIAVPKVEHQAFPHFETYRENIDGKYWFPTYTYADDMLDFKNAPSIHMRMVIRFTNYKKFSGEIRIAGGAPADEGQKGSDKKPDAAKPVPPPNY
ncbi:MAG TPA: hypothetical protein VI756_07355 [Blastocatellia bacterium]